MNAERLLVIAQEFVQYYQEMALLQGLKEIRDALQAIVNQPNDAAAQQKLSKAFVALTERLDSSDYTETRLHKELSDLGVAGLWPPVVIESVRRILQANTITPSVALKDVKEILQESERAVGHLGALVTSLSQLGFGEPGSSGLGAELTIVIPRGEADSDLRTLGRELITLERLLLVFQEIKTGSRAGFAVRSWSSSDWSVLLDSTVAVGLAIGLAVERLLTAYDKLLDIRLKHKQLREAGVPARDLKGIERYASKIMEGAIREIVDEAFSNSPAVDRSNELRTELTLSLNGIANRIDRGFRLQVDVLESEDSEASDDREESELRERLYEVSERLKFPVRDGDKVLSLPENAGDESERPRQSERRSVRNLSGKHKAARPNQKDREKSHDT